MANIFQLKNNNKLWWNFILFNSISMLIVFFKFKSLIYQNFLLDDALFFVRYATNFLSGGGWSWNFGSPSYGSTSQIFMYATALLLPIFHYDSVIFLSIFFLLSSAFIGFSNKLVFVVALLFFNVQIYFHALSGMETTLSLFFIFFICIRFIQGLRFNPLYYCLGYLIRPDLLIFLFVIHIFEILTFSKKLPLYSAFRFFTFEIFKSFFILLGLLLSLSMYYKTPFPLAFFVKSGNLYPESAEAFMNLKYGNISQLYHAARINLIPFAILVFLMFKKNRSEEYKRVLYLLLGCLLFIFYHAFLNILPISNGGARFFVPIYPAIFISLFTLLKINYKEKYPAVIVFFLGLNFFLHILLIYKFYYSAEVEAFKGQTLLIQKGLKDNRWPSWMLNDLRTYKCSLADTELGVIGLLNTKRKILDLSGLNEPRVSLNHNDPLILLKNEKPDLINLRFINYYYGFKKEDFSNYALKDNILISKSGQCTFILAN
jgi:hypothetical protein